MDPRGERLGIAMFWWIVLFLSCAVIGLLGLLHGSIVREERADPNEQRYAAWLMIMLTLSYLESGREGFYRPSQFYELGGGLFVRLASLEVLRNHLDEMERARLLEVTTLDLQGNVEVEKAYKLTARGRRWIEYGPTRQSRHSTYGPPPAGGHGA